MKGRLIVPFVFISGALIFSALIYPSLPTSVPIHWGVSGQPDNYADRWIAVLLAPAFMLVITYALHRRVSLRTGTDSPFFSQAAYLTRNVLLLLMTIVHVASLGEAAGWDIPFIPLMIVTIGLGLAYAANLFTRLEPNWFIGIRFPWTVNNRAVWKRTHRVGGRIMLVAGLLTAAAGLLLPQESAGIVALIALGGGILYLVVWSFSLSRRLSASSRQS